MNTDKVRCLIISEFNAQNLSGYLNFDKNPGEMFIEAECGPFGQVESLLLDARAECWQQKWGGVVVWTTPEKISITFSNALNYQLVDFNEALAEVDAFALLIRQASDRASCFLLPIWTKFNCHRGFGLLDWSHEMGCASLLARMNLRLVEQLADLPQVKILDAGRWVGNAGRYAYNLKSWYLGKIPFGHEVFKAAKEDIRAALTAIRGLSRKLIILDLDETLWGGIVGDLGWEKLRLGGHDPIGEAYCDFQRELKALTNRGILLGIVSKNEESVAFEAIRSHPEMILKETDFVGWKINWNDKAHNIVDLVDELNLGLQSVVFIDDNPAERARVREQLPEILVPEWPIDRMLYRRALLEMTCFDTVSVLGEDQQRTAMYIAERNRTRAKHEIGSLDDWLESLGLVVTVEPLLGHNLARTAQLINKTNQMNLTGRRLTEAELLSWTTEPSNHLWALGVRDRFGNAGLTGVFSLTRTNTDCMQIIDFVLSCRIFGRRIEQLMIALAVEYAQQLGCKEIFAKYLKKPKNKPCFDFFEQSGMTRRGDSLCYYWHLDKMFSRPKHICIDGQWDNRDK